jgi:DedD protein
MEEKNELNDIILNRGGNSNGNKKVLMAIATLAIILIIVVVIMNRLNSDGTENLPQAVLPPEPSATPAIVKEDPLFEPVEVIEESAPAEDNLDRIAQKLKEESMMEEEAPVVVVEDKPAPVKPAPVATKPAPAPKETKPVPVTTGKYYVQVGSFTKFEPNKKFLKSITDSGYTYTYHKVQRNGSTINKVLIGPFNSEKEARSALKTIRKNIESGAFLTKV